MLSPYESLVTAGNALVGVEIFSNGGIPTSEDALAYLTSNRAHLEAARGVLGPDCRVPLEFDIAYFSEHSKAFTPLRNLAQSFGLELWLADEAKDYVRAADIAVDILSLANAIRRGGLVADFLVAVAVAGLAVEALVKMRDRLKPSERRALSRELARIELEKDPLATIIARDRGWEAVVDQPIEKLDIAKLSVVDPTECGLTEEQQRELLVVLHTIAEMPEEAHRSLYESMDKRTDVLLRIFGD